MKMAKILEPSSGGIGSRFKAHRVTFISRIVFKSEWNVGIRLKFSGIAKKIARMKFDIGPASATRAWSLLGFLKYCGFTGTGLPHPIPIKITKCLIGFKLILP